MKKFKLQPLIHIITCGLIFTSVFFSINWQTDEDALIRYIGRIFVPIVFMTAFYLNYIWWIRTDFFEKKMTLFFFKNTLLVIISGILMHLFFTYMSQFHLEPRPPRSYNQSLLHLFFKILRNTMSVSMSVALALAIKVSFRWEETEKRKKELEKLNTNAELVNLKSQINPHFLLNTLNNIYALTEISSEKAQEAISKLSDLLRYILYDNNQAMVLLSQEIDFLHNYIELMRIRLTPNVNVTVEISTKNKTTKIAPLLFITLIENAFKHGTSSFQPAFIKIEIQEEETHLFCKVCNSFFPKKENDKSGSGIGLKQLQKRLDLLYPEQYDWQVEQNDAHYCSTLIIKTNKA